MEVEFISILFLGFVLGIKHAIEPDHVIAVSTIASRSKKLWHSTLSGVFWGIGHSATLVIFGIIVILIKGEIPDIWAMSLEFLVGIMLVYLGITSIFSTNIHKQEHNGEVHKHIHTHKHTGEHLHKHQHTKFAYIKSMIIGFVHGLAGSATMILLTMSTVKSVWEGTIYLVLEP